MILLQQGRDVASILLVFVAVAYAQPSKPSTSTPPVSSGVRQQQDQRQTAQPDQLSNSSQPGVTVNVFDRSDDGDIARSQTTVGNQNPPSDWEEWLPNWFVALFAMVAAGVAYAQWKLTGRQADIAERQNQIVETQNTIMERQNTIMEVQNTLMRDDLSATRQASEDTRASIVMTHRPRVILRNVDVPMLRDEEGTPRIWGTNVGATVAHVIKFDFVWHVGPTVPAKNPYARSDPTQTYKLDMQAGGTYPLNLTNPLPPETLAAWRAVKGSSTRIDSLFLIGVLKYRDNLNNLRRTGFCRRYDRDTGRFVKVDDDDYEHAD